MTELQPPVIPALDPNAIDRFVDVLFGYLDGYVPVRALSETGTPSQKPQSTFPLIDDLANTLKRLAPTAARNRRGLYVVPGSVALQGSAKAEDIVSTGIVLIDLDKGDIAHARDHLSFHLGQPTLEVASGGCTAEGQDKLHLYWRLTEAASGPDLERVRRIRQSIAAKAVGDASFDSMHQPIRVAGTIHGKNGIMSAVRLLEHRTLEYDLEDLEQSAAAMPTISNVPLSTLGIEKGNGKLSAHDLAVRVIHAGAIDEETRFSAISKVIGHWLYNVRAGRCSLAEAWQQVSNHNAAMISPPWENARLQSEFNALHKRDLQTKGSMPESAPVAKSGEHIALSDDALAASFIALNGATWRNVPAWGAWFAWLGTHWCRDESGMVRELVRQVCRKAAQSAGTPSEARRVSSDKTIASALRM